MEESREEQLVKLIGFEQEWEAAQAVQWLEQNGVAATMTGVFASGFRAGVPQLVDVYVRLSQQSIARKLLQEYRSLRDVHSESHSSDRTNDPVGLKIRREPDDRVTDALSDPSRSIGSKGVEGARRFWSGASLVGLAAAVALSGGLLFVGQWQEIAIITLLFLGIMGLALQWRRRIV